MIITPVEIVCSRFGSGARVATLLNINRSSVSRWATKSKGMIPNKYYAELLRLAQIHGIRLTPSELVQGKKI